MELPLKGSLMDSGGVSYGQLAGLTIACEPQRVTHLLVRRRIKGPEEPLPLHLVASAQENRVWLRVSVGELFEQPSAQVMKPQEALVGISGDGASVMAPEPPAGMVTPGLSAETTLRPGARVRARNGPLGEVLSVGLKGRTGPISHVQVRVPHLFRKAEVIRLDWSHVARVEDNTLYLTLDKSEVQALHKGRQD